MVTYSPPYQVPQLLTYRQAGVEVNITRLQGLEDKLLELKQLSTDVGLSISVL